MTNTTKEMMEKIWGKDWDKETFADKVKAIDWADVAAYSAIILATIGLITSILVLVL